jgi:hypothetical protein
MNTDDAVDKGVRILSLGMYIVSSYQARLTVSIKIVEVPGAIPSY